MDVACFDPQHRDFCWAGKQQPVTRLRACAHRVSYVDFDLVLEIHACTDVVRSVAPLAAGLTPREVAPRLWVLPQRYSPILRCDGLGEHLGAALDAARRGAAATG